MSAPPKLIDLIDLLKGVAQRRTTLDKGPVRVEAPLNDLIAEPRAPALDKLLVGAWFVAPEISPPVMPDAFARFDEVVAEKDLYVDLALPVIPDPDAIPQRLAGRIARLHLPANLGDPAGTARAAGVIAERITGRVVLDVAVTSDSVSAVPPLLEALTGAPPRDVRVRPVDRAARDAVAAAWDAWSAAATIHRITVSVDGGPDIAAGEPLDPMDGANVLDACVRALFRSRPSLCPFPFTLARCADGALEVCPVEGGPRSDEFTDDPWNAPVFQETRQRFIDGNLLDVCQTCTLFPKVRRSLAETPWDAPPASDLPIGSIDV